MLLAMFRRRMPAGDWLLPLISGLTVLILAAVAVYVLSSIWRGQTEASEDDATPLPAPDHTGLSQSRSWIAGSRPARSRSPRTRSSSRCSVAANAAAAGAVGAVSNGTVTAVA